ncbi:MAG: hypothetical protein J6125_03940 [Clostridia bacterium]|nr:hypothetical protein [Clostridia bacterium]
MKKALVIVLLLTICLSVASCRTNKAVKLPPPQAQPLGGDTTQPYVVENENYDFAYVTGVFKNAAPVEASAAITYTDAATGTILISHETYTVSGDNIRLIYGYQKATPIVVEDGEVVSEGGISYEEETLDGTRTDCGDTYNFVLTPYGYTLTEAAFSSYRIQDIDGSVILFGDVLPSQINAVFGLTLTDLPASASLRAEITKADSRIDTLTLTLSYAEGTTVITVNYAYTAEPFTPPAS